MTHYLRTRHDAILVGSGTAVADDPGLNSRLEDIAGVSKEEGLAMQPRPVVLDRRGRWEVGRESKVVRLAREGRGKGPWVFTSKVDEGKRKVVEAVGGRVFEIPEVAHFEHIVSVLAREGIRSLMVEGGGTVINEILAERQSRRLVSSVIVTIAPTYLGKGGVNVSPEHEAGKENAPVMRFDDVQWMPLGQDVVMLGKMPADAG